MSISPYLTQKWNTEEVVELLQTNSTENYYTLLDEVIPMANRQPHDSVRIMFDELLEVADNMPHSNRSGEFYPIGDNTHTFKDLVPPPLLPFHHVLADKLKDMDNFYKSGNTRAMDRYMAIQANKMVKTINLTIQGMVADFIKNDGKIFFRIKLPGGGFRTADFTYPGTWTNATAPSVDWNNSSKTLGEIYDDLTNIVDEWEQNVGIQVGSTFTVFLKPSVMRYVITLATAAANTSRFNVIVGRNEVQLNEYRFRSIRGQYYEYTSASPSKVDFLEDKMIYLMAEEAPRGLRYCLQDNLNVGDSAQPIYFNNYEDPRGYYLELFGESKPVPVLSPSGWCTCQVIS